MAHRTCARKASLCVDQLESRYAPARLLGPTQLVYQDKDGDTVTVTFTKPVLNFGNPNTIFTFDSGVGAVNGSTAAREQLRRIDLTSIPVASIGVGITVNAIRSPINGGDGFAAVGEVIATDIDLGAVKIDGDLGRILAGDGLTSTRGLAALTAGSMGRYATSTGASDLHSIIQGKLGALRVHGDVKDANITVQAGDIGSILIAGSVIGGSATSAGTITAEGDIGTCVIRGDLIGGTGVQTGLVGAGRVMGSLIVRGNVIGGSASGTTTLYESGFIYGGQIRTVTIGGSLIAGFDNTAGQFLLNGAVLALNQLGRITINGSMIGNSTSPAVVSAGGQLGATGLTDLAIGSVIVRGHVEHGLIAAGVDPVTTLAYQPVDADAQIGSVVVGGDWIASSIVAGAVAGTNGFFGDGDDTGMVGVALFKDNPIAFSKIGSVTIGGQVLGTIGGTDHYGFVAETIGSVHIGGTRVPTAPGMHTDDVSIGTTGDFSILEI
jgi:hypothetical protein